MQKKLIAGVVAGITTLALAVPAFAQVTGTASSVSSAAAGMFVPRPRDTTQAGIQARIAMDDAVLQNADAVVALLKGATQTHRDALAAAVSITDDAARQTAVRSADDAFHKTIEDAVIANPDLKGALMMPFGGKGRGGPHGGFGGHGGPDMLAQKLGMTEAELKAALDSGKTIEQLATEKGITLPPMMGHRGPGMLAEKLGMTPAELKAALDSGKTLEQIAQEKGVTLPTRPFFDRFQTGTTSSTQQ